MTDGGSLPAPHSLHRLPRLCPRLRLLLRAAFASTPAPSSAPVPAPAPAPLAEACPALWSLAWGTEFSGLVRGGGREMGEGEAGGESVDCCRARSLVTHDDVAVLTVVRRVGGRRLPRDLHFLAEVKGSASELPRIESHRMRE